MKVLPSGWKTATIADTCDILDNKRKPLNSAQRLEMKGSVPYYGANGVVDYINDYIFDEDLILMAEDGGNFSEYLTRPIAYQVRGKSWVNNHAHVLRARPQFNQDYLFYSLEHKDIQPVLNGGTRAKLNKSELEKIELLLPASFEEQHQIATVLAAVDEKLDVIARQIEATQTLKQGLMQTLFSRGVGTQDADDRWVPHTEFKDSELGKLPAGWEVAHLGELLEKLMDFRGRTPKKLGMDWGGGTIPALSANNVRAGYIDFDRECYLGSEELYAAWMVQGDTQKNDLVFTMEAPLGNVAVIPDDRKYILSQRVVLLRTNNRVNHRFLFQYLRSDTFGKILDSNATGTTAKGIQQKRLVQLPVVVPNLEEQAHIANVLDAIDSKLSALAAKQARHQDLKRGLMQKLLTGEWRVKVDAELAA